MRLVGEAADQSFALIERVSLNNEHVFVEMNSDFVPNHLERDEQISRMSEQVASDCNLVLMNCSMDSTTGPGLITFFSEDAYRLVKHFKDEKLRDLAELRRKRQIANENEVLIEDLIADSDEPDTDDFNERLDELRFNAILHRKLSNAFLGVDESQCDENGNLRSDVDDQNDNQAGKSNLEVLIEDRKLNDEQTKQPNKIQFDHKLPFYASTSELLDSGSSFCNSLSYDLSTEQSTGERSIEHSLDSMNAKKCKLNPQFELFELNRSNNQVEEFESSLSSSE